MESNGAKEVDKMLFDLRRRTQSSTVLDSKSSLQPVQPDILSLNSFSEISEEDQQDQPDETFSRSRSQLKMGCFQKPVSHRKNGEEYYEIEGVVDHRVEKESARKNKLMLKVKWQGYQETTWESFKTFAKDSPESLQKYIISLDKRIHKTQLQVVPRFQMVDTFQKKYSEVDLQNALRKQREEMLSTSSWKFVLV
jgi:hypothetical protein